MRSAPRARRRALSAAIGLAVVLVSCKEASGPTPVESVSLAPTTASLVIGTSQQFTGVARDARGVALDGRVLSWSATPASVLAITPSGVVTGLAVGTGVVTVSSEGRSVTGTVKVTSGISSVTVAATTMVQVVGTTQTMLAAVTTQLASIGKDVMWRTNNPAVATVAPGTGVGVGTVTAIAPGAVTISALAQADSLQRASVTITVAPADLNFAATSVTLTQVVQRPDNSVSIVAGNAALLSVYGTANVAIGPSNVAVRVRVYSGSELLVDDTRPSTGVFAPIVSPTAPTHQLLVTGTNIRPGNRVLVEINPPGAGQVTESFRQDNLFPSNGVPLAVDVRTLPPLPLKFIPIFLSATSSQPAPLTGVLIESRYLGTVRRIYPVSQVGVEVGATFSIGLDFAGGNASTFWSPALSLLDAKRVADGATQHYYGVVRPPAGVTRVSTGGFGYVPGSGANVGPFSRTSMGVDVLWWTDPLYGEGTLAHELGHNMGRRHAPCGGALDTDPGYPYPGAVIGVVGWDVWEFSRGLSSTPALKSPAGNTDIMSYCYDWISDYTYQGIVNFRSAIPASPSVGASPRQTVLVFGTISPSTISPSTISPSTVSLQPAFFVETVPVLPDGTGPYTLEGLDAKGEVLFRHAFSAKDVDHGSGEQQFTFAIPVSDVMREALVGLRINSRGRTVALRASSGGRAALVARAARDTRRDAPGSPFRAERNSPNRVSLSWPADQWRGVMVRDPATNEVIGIGVGGSLTVQTSRSSFVLVLSDGVQSSTQVVVVR
ncbi:MAG: Ig-like domain-containing protein [Gemmatimonas sp.]